MLRVFIDVGRFYPITIFTDRKAEELALLWTILRFVLTKGMKKASFRIRQSKLLEMIIAFLALRHDMLRIFPMIGAGPTADTLQNWHYGPALTIKKNYYKNKALLWIGKPFLCVEAKRGLTVLFQSKTASFYFIDLGNSHKGHRVNLRDQTVEIGKLPWGEDT